MSSKYRLNADRRYVVLFDIDGTLLKGPDQGPSAGYEAMHTALAALARPTNQARDIDFAGRTDPHIARMLLGAVGEDNPGPKRIRSLLDLYLEHLSRLVPERPYHVIGDPEAAVRALQQTGAIIGLGTGNLRRGAQLKLEHAGIHTLFDLTLGGYGEDGERRSDLIAAGAWRCDPGRRLPVVVVGDTPHDIEAAHTCGALCVGVPHGRNDRLSLEEAGADAVVDGLDQSLAGVILALLFPVASPI
jgi:phosphoglycolate phosphatase-like HAD superfamily hydrolase